MKIRDSNRHVKENEAEFKQNYSLGLMNLVLMLHVSFI